MSSVFSTVPSSRPNTTISFQVQIKTTKKVTASTILTSVPLMMPFQTRKQLSIKPRELWITLSKQRTTPGINTMTSKIKRMTTKIKQMNTMTEHIQRTALPKIWLNIRNISSFSRVRKPNTMLWATS